jgi:hypothetical protein
MKREGFETSRFFYCVTEYQPKYGAMNVSEQVRYTSRNDHCVSMDASMPKNSYMHPVSIPSGTSSTYNGQTCAILHLKAKR